MSVDIFATTFCLTVLFSELTGCCSIRVWCVSLEIRSGGPGKWKMSSRKLKVDTKLP